MAKRKSDEPSFSDALLELEAILERIENEEIDIDGLAAELGRGSQLLELCRSKIRKAELEVLQIVNKLEAPEPSEDAAPQADED